MTLDRLVGACGRRFGALGEHVFGQRQHNRSGTAGGRHGEGAGDEFGDARRIVDLAHPFCDLGEGAAIFDLLEGLAFAGVALHLADEKDHRDRILAGDVEPGRGIGGAGAARHHANARLSGQPAPGVRHHRRTALLAADDDVDVGVVERIQYGQIAFARHAGDALHTVRDQRLDHQLPTRFHACTSQCFLRTEFRSRRRRVATIFFRLRGVSSRSPEGTRRRNLPSPSRGRFH
ncbi:hypothetical protein ABIA26_005988 [Sinorhizobium fredii]